MKKIKSALCLLGELMFYLLSLILKGIMRFDRYVLKRYLHIETPMYKFWWKNYVRIMQVELNKQQHGRRD